MSSLQKAKEDGGRNCRTLVLARVVGSLAEGISFKFKKKKKKFK